MFLNSENHALSPYWWEGLEQDQQSRILYAINHKLDLMSGHTSSQDNDEIPDVSGWEFTEVMTNVDLG
ncbi:hypothetical protein F960_03232 [Acinetobacter gerneri DSM 14967 = CIP 107464 = MTCC 9824]|uniref:Uncharacterized protein n=2 Tax=Acinetobacter gerneri TaxID=202952 RepID=N8ZMJ2_9GAMM|nr:hypothetical protein F960_03232 [Acinetobacter gerneri DSM 14967 = CIP 107464 = MTCC 9824]